MNENMVLSNLTTFKSREQFQTNHQHFYGTWRSKMV